MKKYHFLLCIGVVFIFYSCSEKESENSFSFQNEMDSLYTENPDITGLIICIKAPDFGINWSGAVGLSDKEDSTSIKIEQPFLIASNTKTYVSATILKLVEQSKVQLTDSIYSLISEKSRNVLESDGYELKKIQVIHLLSHTSGIYNYVDTNLFNKRAEEQPDYKWTRDEQILLATTEGNPLAGPREVYKYSDTNYLLLTEVIETLTGIKFYDAIRELLEYEKHDLLSTRFYSLEPTPNNELPLIHQYVNTSSTYTEDPSFDLYGGGGIITNINELALFYRLLFKGELFDNKETTDLLYTKVETIDNEKQDYRLGIEERNINGLSIFGHTGYWGTYAGYVPEYNATISIAVSNADYKEELIPRIQEKILERLKAIHNKQ